MLVIKNTCCPNICSEHWCHISNYLLILPIRMSNRHFKLNISLTSLLISLSLKHVLPRVFLVYYLPSCFGNKNT